MEHQLRLMLEILINKQFSANGLGWNNIFVGTGGDGYEICGDGRGWV